MAVGHIAAGLCWRLAMRRLSSERHWLGITFGGIASRLSQRHRPVDSSRAALGGWRSRHLPSVPRILDMGDMIVSQSNDKAMLTFWNDEIHPRRVYDDTLWCISPSCQCLSRFEFLTRLAGNLKQCRSGHTDLNALLELAPFTVNPNVKPKECAGQQNCPCKGNARDDRSI
jgi:hypothetical protein